MNGRGAAADPWRAMSDAVVPTGGGRGAELLAAHCAALARLEAPREPAIERLEQRVGHDLAHLLVGALAARTPRTVDLAA
jgi:hypothetical protein